jgi:hypothetical protein
MPPEMVKAQIYVPAALWAKFQSLCKLRRTSASAVLRDAMRHMVARLDENTPLAPGELAAFEAFLATKELLTTGPHTE